MIDAGAGPVGPVYLSDPNGIVCEVSAARDVNDRPGGSRQFQE